MNRSVDLDRKTIRSEVDADTCGGGCFAGVSFSLFFSLLAGSSAKKKGEEWNYKTGRGSWGLVESVRSRERERERERKSGGVGSWLVWIGDVLYAIISF